MPASDSSADTYGWDTVFAINYTDVNNAIATKKSFPPKFDFEQKSDDGDVKMTGTFDAWQIILGGDGQNLWMAMDCPTVAFTMGSVSKSFAAHVEIEVQLELLPQPAATKTKGKNDLKMKSQAASSGTSGTPPPTVVTVRNAKCTPDPGVIVDGVFPECLATWFNQNLQAFNHIFATVDLDADLAKDSAGFKWLMPTHTSYAVVDQGTMDSSVFAVLSMTEDREPTRLNHQVSPNAIPTYARAGFLISRERFLEKMVLPGVPALFLNATTDDFNVDDDGASITNVRNMKFQDLKLDDGTTVHPDLDAGGFSISLSEQTFTLQLSNLHFVYTPGIDVYIQYTSDCSLGIDKDNRIALKPKKMTHKGTVTTTLQKQVIEIATSIAGIVLGAVIGFAIPGGGEVIGTVGAEAGAEAGEAVINEMIVELPDEISEDALGQIDEETNALTTSGEEAAASVEGEGSTWSQFKGWLARNGTKIKYGIMGSVAGGVVGGVAGMVPSMLEAAANGNIQKLPTLDNLASTAAQPTTWPEQKTYKLQSAALNHSWQIGCHPGFAD